MDLSKTSLQSNVEFDAWKFPQGEIIQAADFDWTPYKRWCAVNEYWDGAACRDCPVATTSRGGDVTMCCAADEFWNGQACGACPTGSTGMQYVMCTCAADEFWNGTACQTCPTGSFSLGGAATSTSCVLQSQRVLERAGLPDVPHRLDWHPIRHVHVCHQSVLERADAGVRDVPHRLVQPGRRRDINIVHVLRSQRVLERYRLPDVPHRLVQPGRRRDVNIVHVLRNEFWNGTACQGVPHRLVQPGEAPRRQHRARPAKRSSGTRRRRRRGVPHQLFQ